ncbi:hypothetical protein MVEN_00903400 [Mycena venus]|uniref:Uncharacterized protein n=1 Tax=Mycena venus TaxID=2733690 RepID=A0A8H7D1Y8_9AGAR|nr:hypothetical protein MVEN_00903400 [Mycena venus]
MSSTGRGDATLPIFIRKDTAQKRDSFDSFSDMTASFVGLDYNAPKADKSFGTLSLPNYREGDKDYSDLEKTESSDDEIEVPSLHRASVHMPVPTPAVTEPAHTARRPTSRARCRCTPSTRTTPPTSFNPPSSH